MIPNRLHLLATTTTLIAIFVVGAHGHNIEHLPDWLLLISMDGFRHDYIEIAARKGYNVSAFRRLQSEGATGKTVTDDFVSKTFPNHYTIVTGLHEESHGVLANRFFDPDLERVFSPSTSADTAMWSNGSTNGTGPEPIWVTAQRQKLHSAVVNWPSSAAKIKSTYPTYSFGLYNHNEAMQADYFIERLVDWFESDEHCRLGLLYLPEPDASGHRHGPASDEVLKAIQLLNGHLSHLLKRLESSPRLKGNVNIILTSDHGMTNLNASQAVFIEEIVDMNLFDVHSSYDLTAWHLWPKPNQEELVYQKLKNASAHQPFQVMRRGDPWMVNRHYSYNRRISPITIVANLHAALVRNRTCQEYKDLEAKKRIGDHGYNNSELDMHPIFIAWGPAFVAGKKLDRVRLVDVYPLCCHLLGLHPAPNNGSVSQDLKTALQTDDDDDENTAFYLSSTLVTSFVSFLFVACFTSVFALGALRAYRTSLYRKNRRYGLMETRATSASSSSGNHDRLPLSAEDDDL